MQPVRSADYPAHASLSQLLALPNDAPAPNASHRAAIDAWTDYLKFRGPLLLVKSADRARDALMETFGIADREPVGVPVNTRRFLSEAVKRSGGKPLFVELDPRIEFVPQTPGLGDARLIWAQPVAGMAPPQPIPGKALFVDHGLTLPAPLENEDSELVGEATIWGLHLGGEDDGALIAFADLQLAERVASILGPDVLPDPGRALAQCLRLRGADGFAARQLAVEQAVRVGMEAGAGMPMGSRASGALASGLPVRVPAEADVATFISFVRNERVPLDWLPELQPVFYVANQVTRDLELTRASAEHLQRWVITPLGPDFVDDEVTHAVLGILKAAEYTGVRWYTNPGRARWYSDLLVGWYGPDHDAYHAAFPIDVPPQE